jgi:hypothetical protein
MPLLVAVSLLSAAAIAYEILLTRLFAVALWHHFAYMIISLALLGYLLSAHSRCRDHQEGFRSTSMWKCLV